MKAFRKIAEVKNKKVTIDLPDDFEDDKEVEIIILPYQETQSDNFWLQVSDVSLDEVWNNEADNAYENLL